MLFAPIPKFLVFSSGMVTVVLFSITLSVSDDMEFPSLSVTKYKILSEFSVMISILNSVPA